MHSSHVLVMGVAAAAACRPAPTGPRLPHGPLESPLAAWIPADAAAIVAFGDGGTAAIDQVTTALGWIGPGLLASIDPAVAAAWDDSGVVPHGAVWLLWNDEARSRATCTIVGDALHAADALIAAGGSRQVSAGAELIELGDTTTVARGEVACVVASGAASRRAHHALRLAALTDDDRLLTARPDAAALLGALPAADVVVWGQGELIGGLVEVVPGPATDALATAGAPAIALSIDPATHQARITIASDAPAKPPPRAMHGELPVGALAVRSPPQRRPDVPLPAEDENTDVPFTAEHQQAEQALAASLAGAVDLGQRIDNLEQAARAGFERGWGVATWVRDIGGPIETIEATWDPPAWPADALVAAAQASEAHARADEAELRALYDRAIADVTAKLAALTAIRARDVKAWDRAHRGAVP